MKQETQPGMVKALLTTIGAVFFSLKKRTLPVQPTTILVLKIGAIGDVLMTTPFLRRLREHYPKAKIVYAVGEWSRGALERNPNVDGIIAFPDAIVWRRQWGKILSLVTTLRAAKPDLAFILDKHYFAPLLGFFSGAPFRVGFDRNGEGFANNLNVRYGALRYEAEYNLDLLRALGASGDLGPLEAFPGKGEKAAAAAFFNDHALQPRQTIGMAVGGAENPGMSTHMKRWPLHHYRRLIETLLRQDPNVHILLFGGPGDAATSARLAQEHTGRVWNAAGPSTILQTVALMAKCAAIVTHDSGPMHMAAAAGVPLVALFGPVHPERVAPRGPMVTVLWKPELQGADSYREGKFPQTAGTLECLEKLLPEEVLSALRNRMSIARTT